MKTVLIGHRQIFAENLSQRLVEAIRAEIKTGCRLFTMGTHGDFDRLALRILRKLRKEDPRLQIEVVLTSLCPIRQGAYSDVTTVMYEIEETHYKRRISLSNRKMINTCDVLICYVDEKSVQSGAKTALRYAKRRGLRIVNLYDEKDRPFFERIK